MIPKTIAVIFRTKWAALMSRARLPNFCAITGDVFPMPGSVIVRTIAAMAVTRGNSVLKKHALTSRYDSNLLLFKGAQECCVAICIIS